MDSLTVWRFDAPRAAESALAELETLARDGDIEVADAALVTWPARQRKPSMRDLGGIVAPGTLWGGFWGVLLALIFLVPMAGPTFGAAAGAFAGSLSDFGVGDDYVKRVRDAVTPGTSALFVLGSTTSVDRIAAAFPAIEPIRVDLSDAQAQHLLDALGDESRVR